jgi:hypothetical protein
MRLLYLALVGVLVVGGAAGTAVAKGKIKGKQIAPNAIATKHLKAGAITSDKLADGSVTGPKLAANTVTGVQVDEATLGRVPDAATLKGTSLEPIVLDLPNTQATEVVVASGPGWSVAVDCETTETKFIASRSSSDAMVLLDSTFNGAPPGLSVMKVNVFITYTLPMFHMRVTAITNGSATTQVDISGLFAAGQFGPQKDCYFRGTVTRWP